MLVTLRKGSGRRPVFVFPGAGGKVQELSELAAHLGGRHPIIAVEVLGARDLCNPPRTVEAMAEVAVRAIRGRQPQGPYRLVGYSFGGLVALEVARRLRQAGLSVVFLGLIETYFDRRFWPLLPFLTSQIRRTWVHLGAMSKLPLAKAVQEGLWRAGRFIGRLAQRIAPLAAETPRNSKPNPRQAICEAALAQYRPWSVEGAVTLYQSRDGVDLGCDTAKLLAPHVAQLRVRPIEGNHLVLLQRGPALGDLSRALTRDLAAATAPSRHRVRRVLLATSFAWFNATRLAHALFQAGFAVQALCLRRHTLAKAGFIERVYRYRPLAAQASLLAAIRDADPDLILPADDHIAAILHRIFAEANPGSREGVRLRALISRSLGAPDSLAMLHRRSAVLDIAAQECLCHPPTMPVGSLAGLTSWLEENGYPAVLKADGSWGGDGVEIIEDARSLGRAYRRLSRPPSLFRIAKRFIIDGDASSLIERLSGRRPVLSVQAFVEGRPGNAAVACLNGEVLAAVYAEVVRSARPTGPASVVRIIDHPEMEYSVRAMVKRLGLSGLVGFDYILDPSDGSASLIELNPRATPTCHLVNAQGQQLLKVLEAAVSRRRAPKPALERHRRTVALFPQELQRDPRSPYLGDDWHDVPWQSPSLVALGIGTLAGPSKGVVRRVLPTLSRGPVEA